MRTIRGIPTEYAGVRFRSRLEAKWAAFFDLVSWPWEYEPLDMDGYIPDFVLKLWKPIVVEVKPVLWGGSAEEDDTIAAARCKLRHSGWNGESLIVGAAMHPGDAGWPSLGLVSEWWDEPGGYSWDVSHAFRCLECGRPSFASVPGSWRCRVSGCAPQGGDGHLDHDGWSPTADFRVASNKVQWSAA